MQFITVVSLFSLATIALAQPSAIPEEQNVAVVDEAPEVAGGKSGSAGSFDLDDFLGKLMADLPKKGRKQEGEGSKKKPKKFDFSKVLSDLMGDVKKGGDKDVDLKDLLGDLKGLD